MHAPAHIHPRQPPAGKHITVYASGPQLPFTAFQEEPEGFFLGREGAPAPSTLPAQEGPGSDMQHPVPGRRIHRKDEAPRAVRSHPALLTWQSPCPRASLMGLCAGSQSGGQSGKEESPSLAPGDGKLLVQIVKDLVVE